MQQIPPFILLRERFRSALRQILLFVFFGTAISAVVNSHAIEHYVMEGELLAGIVFMLIFGFLFGIPLWLLFRLIRFVAGH